uniref:RNA helicase n=1 Tax=Hirondellea gigas TaxID=1518452 RepID=A0A6A7G6Z8_9CRUS
MGRSRSPRRRRSRSGSRSRWRRRDSSRDNGRESSRRSRKRSLEHDEHQAAQIVGEKRKGAPFEGLQAFAKRVKLQAQEQLKPVFLSKAQRQALALQRLSDQRKKQREKQDEARQARKDLEKRTRELDNDRDSYRRDNRFMSERDRERERAHRQESRDERNKQRAVQKKEDIAVRLKQDIKDSYLGRKKRKKRVIPPSQKFRFSFDWEATDDTSQDLHPLYQHRAELAMQFGRGYIAGIDRDEQKKKNTVYDDLVKKHKITDEHLRKDVDAKRKERARKEKESKKEKRRLNRHWKEKTLSEMLPRDWRIFKEDYNITTRGSDIPLPLRSWKESKLPKGILESLRDIGYKHPTPVQRMAIPIGLSNRDVVGIAETGSGKTAAFLLPMLVYIQTLPKMTTEVALDGPYALVLAPSRELAQQIENECHKFSARTGIRSAPVVGGVPIEAQAFQLREGAEIVIATPGRLKDCLDRRFTVLNQCNYIVLDEADRMMEMGFQEQVTSILDQMPSSNLRPENPEDLVDNHQYRQTIMFSATMPQQVEFLTKKFLRNPVFLSIGDRTGKSADTVKQHVIFTTGPLKRKVVRELLDRSEAPIMVFCNQKNECDALSRFLNDQGYNTDVLHGGKIQEVREYALASLKDGTIDTLVCTNVAGRGIDIKGVTHVINFDMPATMDEYTHRIGRTGRAGALGEATSLITNADEDIMYELKQKLIATGNVVPHELAKHPAALAKPGTIVKPKILFLK